MTWKKYCIPALTKLNKVLNWLVIDDPKGEDKDLRLMHSEPERIDKFVDFVLAHPDLCKAKAKDVTCIDLRKYIDEHKAEAGTEGIDFNSRFTGLSGILARTLKLRNSDVIKPFGVNVLIDWLLEMGANIGSRQAIAKSKLPETPNTALKFIIRNKDQIWEIIKTAATNDELLDGYDHRPLAQFLFDNADEMGFTGTTIDDWNATVALLKHHNLFSDKPENHMSLKDNYVFAGQSKGPQTNF